MSDIEGIVSFKVGKKTYKLYFGMRAYKEVEQFYDLPFMRAIQKAMPSLSAEDLADKKKVAEASADVRLSDVSKLFEFALLKHQPNIEEHEVDDLIDDLGLDEATRLLGEALAAALISEDGGEGTADEDPPKAASRRK